MKTKLLLVSGAVVLSLVFLLSLVSENDFINIGTKKSGIIGSGNVIKTQRNVKDFESISANGVFDVELKQGEECKIIVESDDNIQKYINVQSFNGALQVDMEEVNIKKSSDITIYIQVVDLKKIELSGVGDLIFDQDLKLNSLEVDNTGVGNMLLKGSVNDLVIRNTGVGNVKALDLVAQNALVKNTGVGNVKVNVKESLEIKNTGVGNVRYSGGATKLEINNSGVGSVTEKR